MDKKLIGLIIIIIMAIVTVSGCIGNDDLEVSGNEITENEAIDLAKSKFKEEYNITSNEFDKNMNITAEKTTFNELNVYSVWISSEVPSEYLKAKRYSTSSYYVDINTGDVYDGRGTFL